MATNGMLSGMVDVRDGTDVDGLTVELWDREVDVPDVSLPYRRLRDLPGLVRRRLGDEPLASTETDGDGAFVVPVDGEPVDAYHVRVYEDETFLGSVDVSDGGGGGGGDRHRSGAGNGRGEQGRNRGGQQGNQGRRRGGQQGGRGGQQGGVGVCAVDSRP